MYTHTYTYIHHLATTHNQRIYCYQIIHFVKRQLSRKLLFILDKLFKTYLIDFKLLQSTLRITTHYTIEQFILIHICFVQVS